MQIEFYQSCVLLSGEVPMPTVHRLWLHETARIGAHEQQPDLGMVA